MKEKILFPNEKIITTKLFDVSQDWEIPTPGFFMISPLRKIRLITEFSDEESIEFINLIKKIREGMKENLNLETVYFFQNEDTNSNFHLWIFPCYNWMKKLGTKIESIRPIMNYAKENMINEEVFKEVKNYVKKMKEFMSDF